MKKSKDEMIDEIITNIKKSRLKIKRQLPL